MNVRTITFFLVLAIVPAMALATAPATRPAPVKVYVAPLSESGSLIRPGWLSSRFTTAIENNLDQLKQVAIVAPTAIAPNNNAGTIGDILTRARNADAEVAVIGVVHAEADNLSVSGEIYDVSSASSFGKFNASGTTQDLFAIQDSITRQIHAMIAQLAQPTGASTHSLANAGTNYQGSDLQASVNHYNFRGLHLSNAANANYAQQPYHLVEQPGINFLLPYSWGGYGYNGYGWPGYTYYPWRNPYYVSPLYHGWGYWPTGGGVIIINQNNNVRAGGHSSHHGHAMQNTSIPQAHQIPPEIATRNQNISHVATPPANTIQQVPSYEIRPVQR